MLIACLFKILIEHLYFQIMAKRKPIESNIALLVYNFAMVALNLYIFVEV